MLLFTYQQGPQVLLLLLLGRVRGYRGAASRRTAVDPPHYTKVAAAGNFVDELLGCVLATS